MKALRVLASWLWLAVLLILMTATSTWNAEQVLVDGEVYFVDADCYSRMTRVQHVLQHPWQSLRFHDFENAPYGTTPHTTAPMDLVIAALATILSGAGHFVSLPYPPLDLAGALISPLLGLGLVAFLWWWSRHLDLPYRNVMLLLVATSPILAHGFLLGRPDHQSLILLLVGLALAAELALWRRLPGGWGILSAAAWALALWTSLFEPIILLTAALAARTFVLGREALPRKVTASAIVFGVILAAGLLFDGWRSPVQAAEVREFFPRWSQTIGELNPLRFSQLFPWTGWLLPVVPLVLLVRFRKTKSRSDLALAGWVLLTIGLSLWYARWGYFLVLVFSLSLPFALSTIPWRPLVWTLSILSLWPIASEWERQLYPGPARVSALAENREDAQLLRRTTEALKKEEPGIILAPWWLSPALVYWTGYPCVAGSSHQSLPGTVDTARFYLGTREDEARALIQKRNVRYIIAYEPSRVLGTSSQILGQAPIESSWGKVLYENPYGAPAFLRLAAENKYFKVYQVRPPIDTNSGG